MTEYDSPAYNNYYEYNPTQLLFDIEQYLKGCRVNHNGEWEQVSQPRMNDEGIGDIIGILQTHLNEIVFSSNLGIDMINTMSKHVAEMIAEWIYLNWYKYDISITNATLILTNIDDIIHCSLMKPYNDKERMHRFGSMRRTENVRVGDEDEKKLVF
jgi:hypothetical protein